MSSEKKITDKIVADAVAEKARILEEAKKQADSVINRAKEQAAKFLENEDVLSDAEAEKARDKEISGAEMQAKKMILAKKPGYWKKQKSKPTVSLIEQKNKLQNFWKMKTFSLMQKQKKQGIKKYQEQKCRQKK